MVYPFGGYGNIYPDYGGYGYGGCNHNYPLNYHSHGSLLATAIGGLITGDYSGYHYAANPVYPSFPIGGYGLGYGGYGMGMGYGGFGGYGGGYGMGYGMGMGYGYGFGNVPYGGFFWGSRPNLPACTGHFNNYRSGQAPPNPLLPNKAIEPEVVMKKTIEANVKAIPYQAFRSQAGLFRV